MDDDHQETPQSRDGSPPAPVTIRPPKPGDGTGLAQCWVDAGSYYAALAPDYFQIPEREGLAESIEEFALAPHGEDLFYRVAERDNAVVGFVLATLKHPVKDAARQLLRDVATTRVTVISLAVQETARRGGIGSQLLHAAEAWARDRGALVISLETYGASPLSVPFYEMHMGYGRGEIGFRKVLRPTPPDPNA